LVPRPLRVASTDLVLSAMRRRSLRKPLSGDTVKRVVDMTLTMKPAGATHWSVRTMAKAAGISHTSVQRIWQAHGLKPHLTRTFKLSRDPKFAEKVADVVGLYLNPPDKALVLCVDEKSQIQALDRTQPGLPMKKGRAGTMTHDYKRNGTTTLFAALDVKTGKVIGECLPRHRAQEFLHFLKTIDRETPQHLDLDLVVDNYATHKTPAVQRWLNRHRRFRIHFTPTSASWLNLVERFFAEITNKSIRRGAFKSVPDLEKAIMKYLASHNRNPKPFVWTAKADNILAKVARAKQAIESVH
jgi:transposase